MAGGRPQEQHFRKATVSTEMLSYFLKYSINNMTEIFGSYNHFKKRPDKSVNGVSQAFAKTHSNWEEDNESNTGCWNCVDCMSCNYCEHCVACIGCNRCVNCRMCDVCELCSNCDKCYHCCDLSGVAGLRLLTD